MKLNLIESKEITDFEKELGVELVVTERDIKFNDSLNRPKYYVSFEGSEVMNVGCLIGKYGNGNTIDEALKNYCQEVSNCRIAFGAYTQNRKEVQFPKLTHTKLLNI